MRWIIEAVNAGIKLWMVMAEAVLGREVWSDESDVSDRSDGMLENT